MWQEGKWCRAIARLDFIGANWCKWIYSFFEGQQQRNWATKVTADETALMVMSCSKRKPQHKQKKNNPKTQPNCPYRMSLDLSVCSQVVRGCFHGDQLWSDLTLPADTREKPIQSVDIRHDAILFICGGSDALNRPQRRCWRLDGRVLKAEEEVGGRSKQPPSRAARYSYTPNDWREGQIRHRIFFFLAL